MCVETLGITKIRKVWNMIKTCESSRITKAKNIQNMIQRRPDSRNMISHKNNWNMTIVCTKLGY